MISVLVLAVTGCSGAASRPGHRPETSAPSGHPATGGTARKRFTVVISPQAGPWASSTGVDLSRLMGSALDRINALLPGPAATITVAIGKPSLLIPQIGVNGYTSPGTGQVSLLLGRPTQTSLTRMFGLWLPRDAAHEVNHSVRILDGTGFGTTLLQQMLTEGIATAFDQAAFPGPPDPWTHAITASQECALWDKAKPQLDNAGLYNLWMFGGRGVPHWTGFTIGYHIINDYRKHHRDVSWAALTSASAASILAGSRYRPCPP
ncbi:MAG: DUF2268 domain-containing protein [Kitasatospora sp.]|nr:DUF2268 domain-containing protein [Kitasatospora sp.]